MKLRNKKTGEIIDDGYVRETHDFQFDGQKHVLAVFKGNGHRPPERVSGAYASLAELNAEWCDVEEEPKGYWYINEFGTPAEITHTRENIYDKQRKNFGNYFSSREEAEKAAERLRAWKRLKDKGFRFTGWTIDDGLRISICSNIDEEDIYDEDKRKIKPDLDELFGGEE